MSSPQAASPAGSAAPSPMDVRHAILAAGSATLDDGGQAWTRLLDVLEATAVGVPLGDDASQLVYRTEPGDAAPTFFAFTDVESAETWGGPASQWAQVPLPTLCQMIRGTTDARLTLNSGGPATVTLDPGSIGYLAASAESGPADDRVSLEVPGTPPPEELVSAVRRVLLAYSSVTAAYLVAIRSAAQSHWGIAVRTDDPAELAGAVEGLRAATATALPAWQKVDVVPLSDPAEAALVGAGVPSVL